MLSLTAFKDSLQSLIFTLILWFSFSGIDVLGLQSFEFGETFSVLKVVLILFVIPLLMYTCRQKFTKCWYGTKSSPYSRGKQSLFYFVFLYKYIYLQNVDQCIRQGGPGEAIMELKQTKTMMGMRQCFQ